jgi:ACS family glucarate transporter-like MFS transporter
MEKDKIGRVRWALIFWMFVVAAVSYLDRNNISIAATAIQQDYRLSNQQLGAVFSAFVAGYALSQPIAGRIADGFGPYRTVIFGMVWWSLFTAGTALVPTGFGWSLAALMGVRLMLGVGEAVIFPAGNRLVANWVPNVERGLANGIIFAGVGVGAGVAPPLITAILLNRDWHWAFYVSAAIGLVVLLAWALLVRDRPEQHPLIGKAEVAYIRAGITPSKLAKPASWSLIVRNRSIRLLAASYFTYGYVAYIFFTWFFKYLSSVRGLDLKTSAVYGMLPFIAMALCSPLGGLLGDMLAPRFGPRAGRCWFAAAMLALCGVFVGLATQVSDARLATMVLAGGAGALYLAQSAYWTLSADLAGPSAGAVSGFMNMCNQIGGVATASFTPWLADRFGWSTSFAFAALLCLLGAMAWLFVDPAASLGRPPAEESEAEDTLDGHGLPMSIGR